MTEPAAGEEELRRMLQGKAMRHLARFSTSRAHLAMLLRRHARKYLPDHQDPVAVIEQVLDRCRELGWQDDARFAGARVRRLHGEGRSTMAMRAHLSGQGVARPLAEDALAGLAEEVGDTDQAAAVTLARRRRLGPWRPPEQRADKRLRDLGVMVRAGFALQLARRVIDASSVEDLDQQ